jgi:PAS domain S-box-containing protein
LIETQVTPYTGPLVLSLLVTAGLSWYGFRRFRAGGDRLTLAFATLMAVFATWEVVSIVGLTATTRGPKIGAIYAANLVTGAVPLAWLWFALSYADRERWVTRPRLALLAIDPVVVTVGTLTDGWHGRMYTSVELTAGSPTYLARDPGPLWNVHALYSYLLVVAGAFLIVQTVYNAQRTYRLQGGFAVAGALIALVGNAAFFVGVGPDYVNLTPLVAAVSGLLFAVGIFRYRFLDLVPVARDTVVDHMAEGYVVLDGNDRIVDLNPAACRLVGTTENEALGEAFAAVFPPAESLVAAGDGGVGPDEGSTALDADLQFDTERGQRHVEASVSPLTDGPGGDGRVIVFRDVTERREVELRYQRLIENATDVVTVLDETGRITFQSPSIERVLGYDPDEMVSHEVFEYIHPEDREQAIEEFSKGIETTGFTASLEYRFRHSDGSWRTIESLGRNLLDDPVVDGVVINSRDVTEQRRRQRRLERTNERLDRFTSVLSHDLRNPLNVAQGNLELAREGDEAAFDEVAAAHDRMRRIVENVLAIAREGDAVADPEPVAVDDVARRAWDAVATEGATLVIEADERVLGDPERLQRALENCYRNAVEHGADDATSLTVTVALEGDELAVADDGAGVDDDAFGELFDDDYTTAADGTGLGLSIVRSVAEAHGWTVRAEAADGGGLRIVFDGVGRA